MDVFTTLIQTVGFPIFVAMYLLHRHEKKLEMLYEEQKQTNVVMAVLVKVLASNENTSIPAEVVDEVSGVFNTPLPPSKKNSER
jgi:hypothetical protein